MKKKENVIPYSFASPKLMRKNLQTFYMLICYISYGF
jgi:hypothetical protein